MRLNMHEVAGLICLVLAVAGAFVSPLVALGLALCGMTSVSIGVIKRTIAAPGDQASATKTEDGRHDA